ncbi:hypothetical protein ABZ612_23665 [Streptomyces avermitilis]|uniref:hypothetical protein n=1 Tax=Streptomyces avermitilis TaxID=33903 RepID=UPI00340DC51D
MKERRHGAPCSSAAENLGERAGRRDGANVACYGTSSPRRADHDDAGLGLPLARRLARAVGGEVSHVWSYGRALARRWGRAPCRMGDRDEAIAINDLGSVNLNTF